MKNIIIGVSSILGVSSVLFTSSIAQANYVQRFSLGAGIVMMNNPSQTSVAVSGEYEYRVDPLLGIGLSANYVFFSPGIALIAVPDLFVHPLAGDWFVSAAPLIELGSSTGTRLGVRLGTRIPLPLGPVTLVPSLAVDFINGGQGYIIGLGFQL